MCLDPDDAEDQEAYETRYHDLLGQINFLLKQKESAASAPSLEVKEESSTCKLPNIDIPCFDGKDFTKFKPFYDLFIAVIGNNKSTTDVQRLFYLRKYLLEDALSVIITLPLTNESYGESIKLLKRRFDNKARLVSNHIGNILDVQTMQKGTAASIRCFIAQIQQQLLALKNLDQPIDKWDMLLISILTRKLDPITNRAYQLDRDQEKLPTMADFMSFLEKRAMALEDSTMARPSKGAYYEVPKVSNIVTKTPPPTCRFCSKTGHALFGCPAFKMAPIEARQSFVKEHELCSICLKKHNGKCKHNFKCKTCKESRNTLLHGEEKQDDNPVALLSSSVSTSILLPTVKVKVIGKNGNELLVRALLDSGSQVSFITAALAEKLELDSIIQPNNIIGIGNKATKINEKVDLTIHSCLYNVQFTIKCHVVEQITSQLPQQFVDISNWNIPENVKLADDQFNCPSDILLLLGADLYFSVLLDGFLKLANGPVLQNTLFGYVVGGNCLNETSSPNVELVTNFVICDNQKLENVMEQFWHTENVPPTKFLQETYTKVSSEFERSEKCFQDSVKLEAGRFYVDMPLVAKVEDLQLGDSFSVALQRFLTLEKKFKKSPLYLEKYMKFIIALGHAKIVDIGNYDVLNGPVYFLAHHAVFNEASITTKLPVVFDGSMKSRSNVSLNDVMLNGPVVQGATMEPKAEPKAEPKVEPKEPQPGDPYLSINNPNLTDEQRQVYESVLATWKPGLLPKEERRFICPHCCKEFKNYQNLYLHTTRVHSSLDAAVMCDICEKTFKNKHYLHMHRMNMHYSESERRLCEFCKQEFRTKKSLEVHIKRAHEHLLPEIRCGECRKDFETLSKLRAHMSQTHPMVKYECRLCNKHFKNSRSIDRHLRTQHEKTERFPCVFCPLTFKTKHHAKRHVLNVHPPLESKVACPECQKEFKNNQYLKEHMQMHTTLEKKVPCDLCGKMFHSELRLGKHKKIVHPPGGKQYRCVQCDKVFAHEHYLKRHVDACHTDTESSAWAHQCVLCDKKFKMEKYLKRHLLRHEEQKNRKVARLVKRVKSEVPKVKKKPGRKPRQAIEFIKCEPVSSSESGSGTETDTDSE